MKPNKKKGLEIALLILKIVSVITNITYVIIKAFLN